MLNLGRGVGRGGPSGSGGGGGGGDGFGSPAGDARNVSLHPASFNQTTTLGRKAKITFNPTSAQLLQGIAQQQTLVFWQGNKVEAQALTVDINTELLAVPPSLPFLGQQSARLYAEIQYGSDGNVSNLARIDLGLGRRITVVGNYVAVNVGADPPAPNTTTPVIAVGASLGTFAAPSLAPAIRSLYYDAIGAGVLQDPIQVPLRAVTMLVPSASNNLLGPYNGQLTITFLGVDGGTLTAWLFDYGTGIGLIPVSVPPDAFYVRVKASAVGTFRVPFQLSL